MKKLLAIITGTLLLHLSALNAQVTPGTWIHIDSSVKNSWNLGDVKVELLQIREHAKQNHKPFEELHAIFYGIVIADKLTEDSLYFKNSLVLDSIVADPNAVPALKAGAEILLAQRLSKFAHRYNKFNRQRYERRDLLFNYAAFSADQLDSIGAMHLKAATTIAEQVHAPVEDFLWFTSDPLIFLFKPGWYDVVMAERIKTISSSFQRYDFRKYLISLASTDFEQALDSISHTPGAILSPLNAFHEWMTYWKHTPANSEYIETLTRKFIVADALAYDNELRRIYQQYLAGISTSPFAIVRAHAVFQLVLSLKKDSKKYNSNGYDEDGFMYEYAKSRIDTAFRWQAAKALALIGENRNLLDSFQYLKSVLAAAEKDIRRASVFLKLEQHNLPAEPILAELKFRNTNQLYYSIRKLNSNTSYQYKSDSSRMRTLHSFPEVRTRLERLPAMTDYNLHSTFLKIDPLPAGNYCLLFSGNPNIGDSSSLQYVYFDVTGIAAVRSDDRIFVLDRKTGNPILNAIVSTKFTTQDPSTSNTYSTPKKVQPDGSFESQARFNEVRVINGSDTLVETLNNNRWSPKDYSYDRDEYNDLVDYHESSAEFYVFTDRSIYRPGQKVYFKILFMTRDPLTGDKILLTKKNLNGLFRKVYNKLMKDLEPKLFLRNQFNDEIDSLKIRINDFGSFSGEFLIPKAAATGEWTIESDDFEAGYGGADFRVEEYKRPNYEVTIEKTKKELLPGESFDFKIKLRSFAGASLNNVRVEYSIKRSGGWISVPSPEQKKFGTPPDLNIDSVGYTNSEGELILSVNDTALRYYNSDPSGTRLFNYNVEIDAIDESGESHEATAQTTISTRPLSISFSKTATMDRYSDNVIKVAVSDQNAGKVSKEVAVQIERLLDKPTIFLSREFSQTDTSLYTHEQLRSWFPMIDLYHESGNPTLVELVSTMKIKTDTGNRITLNPAIFSPGVYRISGKVLQNGQLVSNSGETTFSIFDSKTGELPKKSFSTGQLLSSYHHAGETLRLFYGSSLASNFVIYHLSYYVKNKEGKWQLRHVYLSKQQGAGMEEFKWKIPSDATSQVLITAMHVSNGEVFVYEQRVPLVEEEDASPEIIVERYRKILSPGSKEQFSVSVKTNNVNTVAELLTTMYDGSLDKLEKHQRNVPREQSFRRLEQEWTRVINSSQSSIMTNSRADISVNAVPEQWVWWWKPGFAINNGAGSGYNTPNLNLSAGLSGRVSGLNIINTDGLNEVVVTAYGVSRKKDLGYSVTTVTLRGIRSLTGESNPLIILDGKVFGGDISKIEPSSIIDFVLLKGADATAIYGADAANGVIILSTKGRIELPKEPAPPPFPPRKNFNELAFFFPAVHMGKDGLYSFEFTMPESLTEWKWKMLANTKKGKFAYMERTLNSQLPMMVQPNVPRLLYQGDRIRLKTRISNLDTVAINGQVNCRIEDLVTGADITKMFTAIATTGFGAGSKLNTYAFFDLHVPDTILHPIKLIIAARSGTAGDAEEHIIPVMSRRVFARTVLPFRLEKKDSVIVMPTLPKDARVYGAGLFLQAKPQAAILNGLAYLSEFQYNCAEQTFNKLLAKLTAMNIMRNDTLARKAFSMAKNSIDEAKPTIEVLPDELDESMMPWLRMENRRDIEQKRLYKLLDSSTTEDRVDELMSRLLKLQNSDGGITWFEGGRSNSFITAYLLAGFGRMESDGLLIQKYLPATYLSMISSMKSYVAQYISNAETGKFNSDLLYSIYAYSYWNIGEQDTLRNKIMAALSESWSSGNKFSLNRQAMLITATIRSAEPGSALYQKAINQLESIAQLTIRDYNGIRWKDIADADDLNTSDEEALQQVAEAFTAAKIHPEIIEGVRNWLLNTRSSHEWRSTRGTAAAVGLLATNGQSVTGITQSVKLDARGSSVTVSDDLLKGNYTGFLRTTADGNFHVEKANETIAKGNISYYYFADMNQMTAQNTGVAIQKRLYVFNSLKQDWDLINDTMILKTGDKVKVILTIETGVALQYVYVDDKRGAAFEPVDIHSGYEYSNGTGYYKSVRDQGIQLFAERISSGKTTIEYELKVAQEGIFTNGIAMLQCMYRPDIIAYSESILVQSKSAND